MYVDIIFDIKITVCYESGHSHPTLLISKFWGLRSLWSTLLLWQKASPLNSWYIKDWKEWKNLKVRAEKLQQSLGVESRRKKIIKPMYFFFTFLKNFWYVFYDQIILTLTNSNSTSHHVILIEYDHDDVFSSI